MHSVAKKSAAVLSAIGVAGVSTLFLGAAPASASPSCGAGTLEAGNVCQEAFTNTSAASTFTPTAQMTQLQVLLVGGGGDGAYSGGGGGGQVEIVDFDGGTAAPLTINVGAGQAPSSVEEGTTTVSALPGTQAFSGTPNPSPGTSGVSGNGHAGWPENGVGGGGGGASASPTNSLDGGAGLAASSAPVVNPAGTATTLLIPLFAGDSTCYGGGGSVGDGTTDGLASCNSGSVATGGALVAPTANFGGGAGAVTSPSSGSLAAGASGIVVVRWNATPAVTLTFNNGGHGTAVPTQNLLSGNAPTKPADPAAAGFVFRGWYTDPGLTSPANFASPISASTTFYAAFSPILATTGVTLNPWEIPLGATGLGLGLALVVLAKRRSRTRVASLG